MIIDSSGGLPPPQTFDILIKKNLETEDPRAIEDSDKSNDAKLDANRQNIANNQVYKNIVKGGDIEHEIYNVQGNLAGELSSGNDMNSSRDSISLIM